MMGKSLVSIFVWNPLMIVKLSSFVFDDTNIFVKINFLKHNSHIIIYIYIYKYAWTFHMLNEASESVCSHHFNLDPSHVRNEKCFRRSGKRFGTREPSCNVRFLCGGCFFWGPKRWGFQTWNSIRKKWGFLQVRQVTSEFRWDHIISPVWLLKLLCYHQNPKNRPELLDHNSLVLWNIFYFPYSIYWE